MAVTAAGQTQSADVMGIGLANPGDPITDSTDTKESSRVAGSRALRTLQVPPQPLPNLMQAVGQIAAPRMEAPKGDPAQPQPAQPGQAKDSNNGGTKITDGSGDKESRREALAQKYNLKDIPQDVLDKALKADTLEEAEEIIDGAKAGSQKSEPAQPPAAPQPANPPAAPAAAAQPAPQSDPYSGPVTEDNIMGIGLNNKNPEQNVDWND